MKLKSILKMKKSYSPLENKNAWWFGWIIGFIIAFMQLSFESHDQKIIIGALILGLIGIPVWYLCKWLIKKDLALGLAITIFLVNISFFITYLTKLGPLGILLLFGIPILCYFVVAHRLSSFYRLHALWYILAIALTSASLFFGFIFLIAWGMTQ